MQELTIGHTVVHLDRPARVLNGDLFVPLSSAEAVRQFLVEPVPVPTPPSTVVRPLKFRVVLDAGHGGEDPGAISTSGIREKDLNLDIVKRLDAFLRSRGVQTVLTRQDDTFLGLDARVAIANRVGPDVFVSIHCNAHRDSSVGGFVIFDRDTRATIGQRAEESAAVGPHPSEFDSKPFPTTPAARRAAYEQLFRQYRSASSGAARCIQRAMAESLPLQDRGVQPHKLHLLRWARCPAILVEVAFMTNRREEAFLKDPAFRQRAAEAIGRGLLDYYASLTAR